MTDSYTSNIPYECITYTHTAFLKGPTIALLSQLTLSLLFKWPLTLLAHKSKRLQHLNSKFTEMVTIFPLHCTAFIIALIVDRGS